MHLLGDGREIRDLEVRLGDLRTGPLRIGPSEGRTSKDVMATLATGSNTECTTMDRSSERATAPSVMKCTESIPEAPGQDDDEDEPQHQWHERVILLGKDELEPYHIDVSLPAGASATPL